jgi:adenosylmethionine-8-amino-7-oxononanoate aminotransferase
VEPLIQGAAGMIPQPTTWLRQVADIVRANGAQLIADEVMTGFGRTGTGSTGAPDPLTRHRDSGGGSVPLFACQHEAVQPDFLALAKGMSGGYLPMAATLTTNAVFEAFLGDYSEFKTFFHGHSFTGNQLGSAAALASLDLLQPAASARSREALERTFAESLKPLWKLRHVGDIRRVGLICGIELVKNWRTREAFDLRDRVGHRVCESMARRGVLTRPIGNVIVLMPPFCTAPDQLDRMVSAFRQSVDEVLAGGVKNV